MDMSEIKFNHALLPIKISLAFAMAINSSKCIEKAISKLSKLKTKVDKDEYGDSSKKHFDTYLKDVMSIVNESGHDLLHRVVAFRLHGSVENLMKIGVDVNSKVCVVTKELNPIKGDDVFFNTTSPNVMAVPSYKAQEQENGKTALHIAAKNNDVEMCRILTELGKADKRALDEEGKIPQDLATDTKLKQALKPPCKTCTNCTCPAFNYQQ